MAMQRNEEQLISEDNFKTYELNFVTTLLHQAKIKKCSWHTLMLK